MITFVLLVTAFVLVLLDVPRGTPKRIAVLVILGMLIASRVWSLAMLYNVTGGIAWIA